MTMTLVDVPMASGFIDLGEGKQNRFLWILKEFADVHGFEITVEALPETPQSYSFKLIRSDIILDGHNDFNSQLQSYNSLVHQFAFYRNYFKYPKLDPVEPLRPVVARLLADFQRDLATVGVVTVDKQK